MGGFMPPQGFRVGEQNPNGGPVLGGGQRRGAPGDPMPRTGGITGIPLSGGPGSGMPPGGSAPQFPPSGVANMPAPAGPAGPAGGFQGPNGAQMQQLFRTLLGGEQSNPYGGTVSYEQARAKDPGLDFNTYHQKESQWRDYAGKRNNLMQYLMTKGYSLEDMGLQNKQEFGKHDFDMYGKGGQSTQAGQGLDPAFQYDWANGTKRNTMTSDVNSPTVAISPQEAAAHKQSQDLASKGYDTYASQRWAANKMAHGKQLAPGAQPQHEKLNLDALAQRFGVDPSTLNSQFGQFGGANRPGWGAPAGGTPAGGLTPPPTDVTSAIQNGGNNTSGAPGNVSSIPQASTGQGQGGPNPYASMPNTPQGGFGGGGSNMSGSTGPSFMAPRYSPGGMGQRQGRGSIMGLGNQKGNNMSGSMPGPSGGF